MNRFFSALQGSIESHSALLRKGKSFLPAYLKGKKLVHHDFPPVARQVARRLSLKFDSEIANPFPPHLKIGYKRQIVDYVYGDPDRQDFFGVRVS